MLMVRVKPLYQDPFKPVLTSSVPLEVTAEQLDYIQRVLEKSSSDRQFADKAFKSILYILTNGSVKVPTVTSLVPNSTVLGNPSFTLHVHGTNFTNESKIVFAGFEEPTTFLSATELSTGEDMSVWNGPDVVEVMVQSADGILSNPSSFTFESASASSFKSVPVPKPVTK